MNEKISSALDGLKDMAAGIDLKETVGRVGEKVKETVSEIDIKATVEEVTEKYRHGGVKEAVSEVGETLKEVAGKAAESVRKSLRENPGAAVDNGDNNAVTAKLVDERTAALNNNPRNGDMRKA